MDYSFPGLPFIFLINTYIYIMAGKSQTIDCISMKLQKCVARHLHRIKYKWQENIHDKEGLASPGILTNVKW